MNLLIATPGLSGAGKGRAADHLDMKISQRYIRATSASGEKMQDEFWTRNDEGETVLSNKPVLFSWAESDVLESKMASSGSLSTTMRELVTGAQLGTSSVSRPTPPVPSHKYRSAGIISTQPRKAGFLVSADGGGLTQRILWMDALVGNDFERNPLKVLEMRRAALSDGPTQLWLDGPINIVVTEEIELEVIRMRIENNDSVQSDRAGFGAAALETHSDMLQLKIAAIYAGWKSSEQHRKSGDLTQMGKRGGAVVGWEAWCWAGAVLTHSRRVRAFVAAAVEKELVNRAEVDGARLGHGDLARNVVKRGPLESCMSKIRESLEEPGTMLTRRKLQSKLSEKQRDFLDSAIMNLLSVGDIERVDSTRTSYFQLKRD